MKRRDSQQEVEKRMWGRFYWNPDDSNIFVRRRAGLFAWTMNLGNGWSWLIMLLEAAVVLSVVWLMKGCVHSR